MSLYFRFIRLTLCGVIDILWDSEPNWWKRDNIRQSKSVIGRIYDEHVIFQTFEPPRNPESEWIGSSTNSGIQKRNKATSINETDCIMTRKMIKKVIGSPYFLKIKAINCCKLEEKAQKVNWNGLKNSLDLILSIRHPHIRTFGGLLLILSDGLSTKSPWIPCWKIFHPGTYFKTEINSKLLI